MPFLTTLVLFGVLTLLMLGFEIMFTYATKGFGFGFSANRNPSTVYSPLALRVKRAYQNQIESAAYGVPVLAAAAFIGLESGPAETAAMLFILGRAAFALLYYTGVSFVRVPAFLLSTLSTFYIAFVLLTSGLL